MTITGQTTLQALADMPSNRWPTDGLAAIDSAVALFCPGAYLASWYDQYQANFRLCFPDNAIIPLDPARTVLDVLCLAARRS